MADLAPGTVATELMQLLKDGAQHCLLTLSQKSEREKRQISDAAGQLRRRGLLCHGKAGFYQLTKDGVKAAHAGLTVSSGPIKATGARRTVPNTFRKRAWLSMRFHRQFTLSDIIIDASAGEKNPHNNLVRYVRYLCWAGYVVELRDRQRGTKLGSNGFKRYQLVKNTGPNAPVYSKARETLRDPNAGKEFPCKPRS